MTYSLVSPDNPILRQVASQVDHTEDVTEIVTVMFDICRRNGGVALAAPQIGVSKQIIVIDLDGLVLVNPRVRPIQMRSMNVSNTFPMKEGCLSLPGEERVVRRSMFVEVIYEDHKTHEIIQFYAHGLYAAVLQHEYDHLYGKLITDYTAVV